jgi:hypothetical protein
VQSQEQEVLEIFLVDVGWLVIQQSPFRRPVGLALSENLQLKVVVVLLTLEEMREVVMVELARMVGQVVEVGLRFPALKGVHL